MPVQFFFATQLLESVPYRNLGALSAQELTPEKRRLRLEEAKEMLENMLGNVDKSKPLWGKALNNKAAAIIHLADYSCTWEDIFKKHLEAYEMVKTAACQHPSLSWPKFNLVELNLCMRVLAEEPRRNPGFAEDYVQNVGSPEKGLYLTDLRDIVLVARGDSARKDMLLKSNHKQDVSALSYPLSHSFNNIPYE